MRLSSLSFPFATAGTLMILAACGPNQKRAIIGGPSTGAVSTYVQAVTACKDSLRPSLTVSVGSAQQKLSVATCQPTVGVDGKSSLQMALLPVSYRIAKNDLTAAKSQEITPSQDDGNQQADPAAVEVSEQPVIATISMSIGLDVGASFSNDEQTAFAKLVSKNCGAATSAIFNRSSLKAFGRLAFAPKIHFAKIQRIGDPIPKFDQILSLKEIKVGGDVGYAMTDAKAGTDEIFFPNGRSSDFAACQKARDSKASYEVQAAACAAANDANEVVNKPFCAAFARKVTTWLGLASVRDEAVKCGSKDPGKITDSTLPVSTFVSSPAKGQDYLDQAALNDRDFFLLLGPACPDIKKLSP